MPEPGPTFIAADPTGDRTPTDPKKCAGAGLDLASPTPAAIPYRDGSGIFHIPKFSTILGLVFR
ncbi:MAG: hypothetical protein EOM66_08770 [Clostridia bacterium]|nr:hypothetical protein [Clostridia bacterium]